MVNLVSTLCPLSIRFSDIYLSWSEIGEPEAVSGIGVTNIIVPLAPCTDLNNGFAYVESEISFGVSGYLSEDGVNITSADIDGLELVEEPNLLVYDYNRLEQYVENLVGARLSKLEDKPVKLRIPIVWSGVRKYDTETFVIIVFRVTEPRNKRIEIQDVDITGDIGTWFTYIVDHSDTDIYEELAERIVVGDYFES